MNDRSVLSEIELNMAGTRREIVCDVKRTGNTNRFVSYKSGKWTKLVLTGGPQAADGLEMC